LEADEMSGRNPGPFDFSCNVTKVDTIPTPNLVTDAQAVQLFRDGKLSSPTIRKFTRSFFSSGKAIMPDGVEVQVWGFADEKDGKPFPSPQIRLMEGELAQVKLNTGKRVHTIHHHGIEPDPFNDGVGHTSFETSGTYTYQFRPSEAGSYWYHCHVNTVLHVQMGLFGTLVVDPLQPATDPKRVHRDGPVYVHERYWVPYSIDPRWHTLEHAAGLCGEDVGLNNFVPKYFGISGKFQKFGNDLANVFQPTTPAINDPTVALTAPRGEPILIRVLNGQYFPIVILFGDPAKPLPVRVVATDGRPCLSSTGYGVTPVTAAAAQDDDESYRGKRGRATCEPQRTGQTLARMTPAERYDLILNEEQTPAAPGVYPITVNYLHWITRETVGVARTTITIT
jgi:FtsP/CotA-like multicopper oxidase with cupredoxin domain